MSQGTPLHTDEYWQEDGGYVVRCRCGWEHWGATHVRAMDFFAEHVCEVLGWEHDSAEAQ